MKASENRAFTLDLQWEKYPPGKAASMLQSRDIWVFQFVDSGKWTVVAMDLPAAEVKWALQHKQAYTEQERPLHLCGDTVVLLIETSEEIWFLAGMDLHDGQLKWKIPVDARDCRAMPAPFLCQGDRLYLYQSARPCFQIWSLENGEKLEQIEGPAILNNRDLLILGLRKGRIFFQHYDNQKNVQTISFVDPAQPGMGQPIVAELKRFDLNLISLHENLGLIAEMEGKEIRLSMLDFDADSQPALIHTFSIAERTADFSLPSFLLMREDLAFLVVENTKGQKRKLYALNIPAKKVLWKQEFKPHSLAFLMRQGDRAFACCKGKLWLLDPETKPEETEIAVDSYSRPACTADAIFYHTDGDGISQLHSGMPLSPSAIHIPEFPLRDAKDILGMEVPMNHEEKRTKFLQAVEATRSGAMGFEALYSLMKRVFEIANLDEGTCAYIEQTINQDRLPGPLFFEGFGKASAKVGTWHSLFGYGPKDELFPGLLVATETAGHYFYLRFELGAVVSAHHDSILEGTYNMLNETWGPYRISGLMKWQAHFSQVRDTLDLAADLHTTVKAIAEQLGLGYGMIPSEIDSPEMVVFRGEYSNAQIIKASRELSSTR